MRNEAAVGDGVLNTAKFFNNRCRYFDGASSASEYSGTPVKRTFFTTLEFPDDRTDDSEEVVLVSISTDEAVSLKTCSVLTLFFLVFCLVTWSLLESVGGVGDGDGGCNLEAALAAEAERSVSLLADFRPRFTLEGSFGSNTTELKISFSWVIKAPVFAASRKCAWSLCVAVSWGSGSSAIGAVTNGSAWGLGLRLVSDSDRLRDPTGDWMDPGGDLTVGRPLCSSERGLRIGCEFDLRRPVGVVVLASVSGLVVDMVGMDELEFMKMAEDGRGFGGVEVFKGRTMEARFPGTFRAVLLVMLEVLETEDDLEDRVFCSVPRFNEASESFSFESGCLGGGFVDWVDWVVWVVVCVACVVVGGSGTPLKVL